MLGVFDGFGASWPIAGVAPTAPIHSPTVGRAHHFNQLFDLLLMLVSFLRLHRFCGTTVRV